MIRTFLMVGWLLALCTATPAAAVNSITHHVGTFNGHAIRYTATVEQTILHGPDGKPAASLVTIAYVREGGNLAHRPVMFVFNGGPGASSSPLHTGAFGPRRIVETADGNVF